MISRTIAKLRALSSKLLEDITLRSCLIALMGSAILSFGIYNIHSLSGVTEGGVLGMTLLLEYWFRISPALSSFVLSLFCYILGWRTLGRKFIVYSGVATAGFSVTYWIFEQFPPVYPQIADMPLVAAILGAVFVGVGAGLCVRIGGATGGDDALAMSLSAITHLPIQWIYLISDLVVLTMSLSYIPFRRIIYSLLTVILSGQLIGIVQNFHLPGKSASKSKESAPQS